MAMLKRSITPGSRQAPDPYDQFLESNLFYRKHTARDASCLFRVIAEQMYDTQMLHYEVRLECVRFMTRKRSNFEKHIDGDFDSYLLDLAKPRTYGTMLELRAVCCMYRRNVMLFEPFDLGTFVTYDKSYRKTFNVFCTNLYHFDSVYTLSFIQDAAICQAISFKLLYQMIFKLPDVNYAVETMLHPRTFDWGNYHVAMYPTGYIKNIHCRDGRIFHLDLPEDTKCILENFQLCNFHNCGPEKNMNATASSSSSSSKSPHASDMISDTSIYLSKSMELLFVCPDRYNSCVRQLLDEGITPFPYKVAKALDPYIYRNIEFDSWNDVRKEAKRFNIYINDYNFKIGAKCHVELLIKDDRKMFTGHIQKIFADKSKCIVFVEKFGKEIVVPYVSLHPLPPDEFRPWSVPIRSRRQALRNYIHNRNLPKFSISKWRNAKVYDTKYFETSSCEIMQYLQLDNYYGCQPLRNEQHPNLERFDQDMQREQYAQLFHQQPAMPPPLPSLAESREAKTASMLTHPQHQPQQPGTAQLAMAGPMGHGKLTPSWLSTPLSLHHLAEENQAGVYPGMQPPKPSADGMLMHLDRYTQPLTLHLPTVSPPQPQPQPQPQPSFAKTPYLIGPTSTALPPLMLPQSSSSNSCTTSSVSRTIASRCSETQLEPSRGMDLQSELTSNLNELRYFYNIGRNMLNSEQMRMFGNGINHNQSIYETHYNAIQENLGLAASISSTLPPSPEATGAVPSTELAAEKKPLSHYMRGNNYNYNKIRSEVRPELLTHLGYDKQKVSHSIMFPTPTPTPSPNSLGNKFNFYPTPPKNASQQQQQQARAQAQAQAQATLPTSTLLAAIRAGQVSSMQNNPYVWGMSGISLPLGGANVQNSSQPSPYGPSRN